jgi:sugar phosphate isomerase/epimerase
MALAIAVVVTNAMKPISRRSFFVASSAVGITEALGASFKRVGKPNLRLSLAAYSFRSFFKFQKNSMREVHSKPMDMFKFIDFCADHHCDGAELTSYFFRHNVTRDYLIALRRHAFLRGVDISGTAVGNNFSLPKGEARDAQIAYVKKWIDHAAVLGAPHIRVFAGREAKGVDRAEADKWAIAGLRECCDYAGKHGIFLGIENHDSIGDAKSLINFLKSVDHPWFGVNLDSGNFRTTNPYVDFAASAPYAVNVQLKVELKVAGKKEPADLKRVADILRKTNYQGYVVLEYEAAQNPYAAIPPLLKDLRAILD